ncbi:MAG: penicillin-binding protein 2 [Deltaproteobacteria bacterium]|nr:penicillin-binding protein 2 [Deltaproteobacteria bacterium]
MIQRIRKREQDPGIAARIRGMLWVALAGFLLLLIRLYWLQVVQFEHFRTLSENNRLRIRTVRAPRGEILDRNGRPIAETQASFDLICSPVDVADLEGEIRLIEEIVEFDAEETLQKIRAAKKANPYSAVTVARDLRFEQVSVIEFNREALSGFSVLVEAKRSYPEGPAFAHALGYVGEVSQEELDRSDDDRLAMGDIVGKYGLERLEDKVLRGINGGRRVEVDAAGRDKRLVDEVPSRSGGVVRTTLDEDIQRAAQEAIENRAGAVIAMVPKTGDILAFVSAPPFDPNVFSRGILKSEWQALSGDPRKPMQNKGLQGTYAPGSTVKPFVALAALEEGVQDPKSLVRCPGYLRIGNRSFRCWREKGHGVVDMYKGIVQSCDVFFYTMGLRLGPDRIAKLEKEAGLGTITGIELPGERKGLVPDTEWKQKVSKERWYDSERAILGIGQGYIHVTPLEMLAGYAAIATGGEVMRPRLVTRVTRMDGAVEERPPQLLRKLPWKPENVAFIRRALAGVVNDYGTGGAAKIQGIEVGGKTGTAQVAAVKGKMIKSENLPYQLRDHAWFAAIAPVSDPEICVVAMVEHGGHGGSAAAPIVKAVMQEYFRTKQNAAAGNGKGR